MLTTRRSVMAGLGATLVTAGPAAADVACSGFNGFGIQQCTAAVRVRGITARQDCDSWCWAACIETIFGLHGYQVAQEEIVEKLFGQLVCATATGVQIAWAIDGRWRDRRGRVFMARPRILLDMQMGVWTSDAAAQAAQDLARGNPLINGALGHATVMTAMTYLRDGYGRGQPVEIVVRDPWPGNRNRRVLSPQEAYGTFFLAAIDVWS